MIRRRDNPQKIITQTSHGWLAGQFAAYWGNKNFYYPDDLRELQLATANHDQGWYQWEQNPRLNAENRPTDFMEMPVDVHLEIWRQSILLVASQSRYAAILISQHGRYLNERRMAVQNGSSEGEQIKFFCDTYRQWEAETLAELQQIPYFAKMCQPDILRANVRLLQVFDWLSLLFGMDELTESQIVNVPGASVDERVTISLIPQSDQTLIISPWTFRVPSFDVTLQYRQLPAEIFEDDASFQSVWHQTPVEMMTFTLKES